MTSHSVARGERPEGAAQGRAPRVLVTRSREGAGRLSALLEARGMNPVEVATIAFRPRPVPGLGRVLEGAPYDVLLFTSANGVRYLARALREIGREPGDLPVATTACVGPATAAAAEEEGWRVSIVPKQHVAEGLVTALLDHGVAGRRLLFARAAKVREGMVDTLRFIGATVRELVVYESSPPPGSRRLLAEVRESGLPVLITAASSQTIRNLHDLIPEKERPLWMDIPVVSIGPITSATVRELGWRLGAEAREASLEALADACESVAGKAE